VRSCAAIACTSARSHRAERRPGPARARLGGDRSTGWTDLYTGQVSDPASVPPPREDDPEEVDALPVLAAVAPKPAVAAPAVSRELDRPRPRPLQAAAMAAGGFAAGAAVAGLVHRRRSRRSVLARPLRRGARGPVGELVQIVGSRSLLVDVHLLSGRD